MSNLNLWKHEIKRVEKRVVLYKYNPIGLIREPVLSVTVTLNLPKEWNSIWKEWTHSFRVDLEITLSTSDCQIRF